MFTFARRNYLIHYSEMANGILISILSYKLEDLFLASWRRLVNLDHI